MSAAGMPLAALRARCLATQSDAERERWLALLRADPRRGARSLVLALERRARAERAERARLRGLFALRARLLAAGARRVAGVDEVGMGPLAGPVIAAAVIFDHEPALPGLDDSKRLSRTARERLAEAIHAQALGVGFGVVEPAEIDRLNIHRAGLEAMRRAVLALAAEPDHVLVDARTIPALACRQTAIVGGDAKDASIAAASIVAKVARDALMRQLDERHPGWGFAEHMGYPTPRHLEALARLGPSPVHRRSFAPVARVARGGD